MWLVQKENPLRRWVRGQLKRFWTTVERQVTSFRASRIEQRVREGQVNKKEKKKNNQAAANTKPRSHGATEPRSQEPGARSQEESGA